MNKFAKFSQRNKNKSATSIAQAKQAAEKQALIDLQEQKEAELLAEMEAEETKKAAKAAAKKAKKDAKNVDIDLSEVIQSTEGASEED